MHAISPGTRILTHLVEVLQQVDYPALNLALVQTGGRGVSADRLRDEAGSELRDTSSDGRAADLEGSRGLDGDTGGGGSQGADNGGAEHYESNNSAKLIELEERRNKDEWCGGR